LQVRLALMTEPQLGGGYDDLSWAARTAEAAGLEAFARSDHYYWRQGDPVAATEAFSTLGGLARETSRIRLAVLVTPITFRHPSFIAKASATLDQMSGGRFDLGIGTGWMEAEHQVFGIDFPRWSERFARLEEALAYTRAAFDGSTFEGRFYQLTANVLPRPSGVHLLVGGSGPEKTPALAGRFADEYNQFLRPIDDMKARFEAMRAAASAAGRDPEQITLSVMGPAIVSASQAGLRKLLEGAASFRNITIDELVERWKASSVPFGTPEEVAEILGRLQAAGVEKYYLQWLHVEDHEGIAQLVNLATDL
jgi:alkanesulfonate monooxygenase SsuD/methylene tetrahydromethanopterin reductase-like flavin-dependent oxidoreductase (luciferase family)